MKFLKDVKAIERETAVFKLNAKTLQGQSHLIACSILKVWAETGNVAHAVRLTNDLLEAMPDMTRSNAMKAWFETFAGFVWDVKEKVFKYHKERTTIDVASVQSAVREPWWQFKPEAPYKPIDIDALMESLIKRAEKRREDGLKDGDSVPAVKLKALKLIRDASPEKLAAMLEAIA